MSIQGQYTEINYEEVPDVSVFRIDDSEDDEEFQGEHGHDSADDAPETSSKATQIRSSPLWEPDIEGPRLFELDSEAEEFLSPSAGRIISTEQEDDALAGKPLVATGADDKMKDEGSEMQTTSTMKTSKSRTPRVTEVPETFDENTDVLSQSIEPKSPVMSENLGTKLDPQNHPITEGPQEGVPLFVPMEHVRPKSPMAPSPPRRTKREEPPGTTSEIPESERFKGFAYPPPQKALDEAGRKISKARKQKDRLTTENPKLEDSPDRRSGRFRLRPSKTLPIEKPSESKKDRAFTRARSAERPRDPRMNLPLKRNPGSFFFPEDRNKPPSTEISSHAIVAEVEGERQRRASSSTKARSIPGEKLHAQDHAATLGSLRYDSPRGSDRATNRKHIIPEGLVHDSPGAIESDSRSRPNKPGSAQARSKSRDSRPRRRNSDKTLTKDTAEFPEPRIGSLQDVSASFPSEMVRIPRPIPEEPKPVTSLFSSGAVSTRSVAIGLETEIVKGMLKKLQEESVPPGASEDETTAERIRLLKYRLQDLEREAQFVTDGLSSSALKEPTVTESRGNNILPAVVPRPLDQKEEWKNMKLEQEAQRRRIIYLKQREDAELNDLVYRQRLQAMAQAHSQAAARARFAYEEANKGPDQLPWTHADAPPKAWYGAGYPPPPPPPPRYPQYPLRYPPPPPPVPGHPPPSGRYSPQPSHMAPYAAQTPYGAASNFSSASNYPGSSASTYGFDGTYREPPQPRTMQSQRSGSNIHAGPLLASPPLPKMPGQRRSNPPSRKSQITFYPGGLHRYPGGESSDSNLTNDSVEYEEDVEDEEEDDDDDDGNHYVAAPKAPRKSGGINIIFDHEASTPENSDLSDDSDYYYQPYSRGNKEEDIDPDSEEVGLLRHPKYHQTSRSSIKSFAASGEGDAAEKSGTGSPKKASVLVPKSIIRPSKDSNKDSHFTTPGGSPTFSKAESSRPMQAVRFQTTPEIAPLIPVEDEKLPPPVAKADEDTVELVEEKLTLEDVEQPLPPPSRRRKPSWAKPGSDEHASALVKASTTGRHYHHKKKTASGLQISKLRPKRPEWKMSQLAREGIAKLIWDFTPNEKLGIDGYIRYVQEELENLSLKLPQLDEGPSHRRMEMFPLDILATVFSGHMSNISQKWSRGRAHDLESASPRMASWSTEPLHRAFGNANPGLCLTAMEQHFISIAFCMRKLQHYEYPFLPMFLHDQEEMGYPLSDSQRYPHEYPLRSSLLPSKTEFRRVDCSIPKNLVFKTKTHNIARLVKLCRLQLNWTDRIEEHLNLDDLTGTLSLFRFACLCVANTHVSGAPEGSQALYYNSKYPCTNTSIPYDYTFEILQSYRLLFSTPSSRRLFKEEYSHNSLDDEYLFKICTETPKGISSKSVYQITEFEFLAEKMSVLDEYFNKAKPSTLRQLFWDSRDTLQWYTFIIGMAVFTLTIVGLILGVLQTVASFLELGSGK